MQCGLMPSTPNHEKQFQFHSTRKKSKSSITRMSKPSKEEVEHQREKLGRETSVFCGICLKLDSMYQVLFVGPYSLHCNNQHTITRSYR